MRFWPRPAPALNRGPRRGRSARSAATSRPRSPAGAPIGSPTPPSSSSKRLLRAAGVPSRSFRSSLRSSASSMAGRKEKRKPVAVFDIDGTVFRSSLLVELIEALVAEGIFPKAVRAYYAEAWRRWQAREGSVKTGFSYYEFIASVVFAYRKHITGIRRAEVWRVAERVVAFHRVRLYRFTRELVKKLRRTHFLLAISQSPYEVVAPFAKPLRSEERR